MNFLASDGVRISYQTYGDPQRQSLIFVNGYSASQVTWLLQIDSFVAAGYYVVTYDHRNHGESEKVKGELTIDRLAADLADLIAHLGLKQPILVGHSMGSAAIEAYEEAYTDAALCAVVTEDQAPVFFREADWLDGKGLEPSDLPAFVKNFPKTRLTRKPLAVDVKRELGKGMYPFNFTENEGLLRSVIKRDFRPSLMKEKVPHLFLAGGDSTIFSPEHAAAARSLQGNPASESLIFPGSGHIPHLEDPVEFNKSVQKWLKKIVEA